MLDEIIKPFKNFRDTIYDFFSLRRDAAFELIDSLSCNTTATSVVELSLNPVHRRNYCSITRVVDEFYSENIDRKTKNEALTGIIIKQCVAASKRKYFLLGVDCTPNPRRYAPTQQDRGFVYAPNTISGNKPVTIGHQYSFVALLPEKNDENSPPWIVPLSCHRVLTSERSVIVGMQQISHCISQKPFQNKLCVSVADSAYSNADPIYESNKNQHQVHISRLRNNRVLYHISEPEHLAKNGRKKCFGDPFYLNKKETWKTPDERKEFDMTTKKGKNYTVQIECWNNIIMRGTQESNISKNPMRLLKIGVHKESGELLFKKPLWLIVSGRNRLELSLNDMFDCYRQRFDIEHFFRFGKNKLLMDKSQTPDIKHEEAWWQLTMIAYVQLFLTRSIAKNMPKPWEKYLTTFKQSSVISPTQVQKDFAKIIRMFGTPAKPPKRHKNAPGRHQGEKQIPRTRYSIVKKSMAAQLIAAPA